ncbi:Na+/H+ antiporter subunit E [Thermogladius sp. KZ2Tp1]|uniref:Na+/H+ antiporter subunit E n=1 Tax=Thermogladius sp. KZ2Tp1 TaxID=3136289 RepID=UPI003DA89C0F
MKRLLVVGLSIALVYLVYTGTLSVVEVLIAVGIGLALSRVIGVDLVKDESKLSVRRFFEAVKYALKYFTIIEYLAHYSVVKAILSRDPGLKPAIVEVPYYVNSEIAVVTIANSITNTPGTVVVDVDEKRKKFYVHWIFAEAFEGEEARRGVSAEFEEWAKKIFD